MEEVEKVQKLSLDTSIAIPEDVVHRELGGEALILNLETGTYFGLNEVGARIWQLIQDRVSLRSVRDHLTAEYDAPPAEIEADLLQIVERLAAKGLVRVVDEA